MTVYSILLNSKDVKSKAPDFDAHIGAGPKVFHPPYEQAHVGLDLLTLASSKYKVGNQQ